MSSRIQIKIAGDHYKNMDIKKDGSGIFPSPFNGLCFYLLRFSFAIYLFFISSCTKDITISLPHQEEQIVVEGFIETGLPPYVILTKSSDFYSTFSLDSISNYFVSNAIVRVSDGTDTVTLYPISFDTSGVSISIYTNLAMIGEVGKTYFLWIETEGKILSSVTTIPQPLPLDSIWWEPANIPESDIFVKLICRYSDPPELGQYVRYFTKQNSQPFYPGLSSVFEDNFINGNTFDFELERGVNRNDTTQFYPGYFKFTKGDTITVKWSAIDEAQFNFWRTYEFELGGQGSPFASPVYIQSNIVGGLGIWGGYSPSYKTMIVPE